MSGPAYCPVCGRVVEGATPPVGWSAPPVHETCKARQNEPRITFSAYLSADEAKRLKG